MLCVSVTYKTGNVLDAKTDALLVAVDGDNRKLIGAVGQQLASRIDDSRDWEQILAKADYPIAPGCVRVVDLEEYPEVGFKFVIFACMFNHNNKELYLENAYSNALGTGSNWGVRSLATVLYRGGWRGTVELATAALERAVLRVPEVQVEVWERATSSSA